MSNPRYVKVSGAFASAVATDGTVTIPYPSGYSSSDVAATGAKIWLNGLMVLLTQGNSTFTLSHSTNMTFTNKVSTTLPAGSTYDLYLPIPQPGDALADLTENGGAIGGTNDGDLPSLTATYTARTGSLGGTANGSLVDEGTLSTSDTYTDSAVNTVLGKIKDNLAEVNATVVQLAADNVALRAAIRENAARLNEVTAALADYGVIDS
jgi:hypothetical protein